MPDPLLPAVTVSQLTLLAAVQLQPPAAVTAVVNDEAAAAETLCDVGEIE